MLKRDSFLRMAEVREEWCVSVYMPIDRIDAPKNRIRLKNLMFEAEKKLLALEMLPATVSRILAPIEMILENADFWKNRTEGFAAFFTYDSFVWHSMNYKFDELVVVTDRFHLKPLLRNASQTRRFHLLTLSQNKIKLYEASEEEIHEIHLNGLPRNIEFALRFEDGEKHLQSHSSGKGAPVFHGNGGSEDNKDAKLTELFRKVDRAVCQQLKGDESPLLLAGVESLHSVYHSVNNYPQILQDGLTGNFDHLNPKELLEKALPTIMPAIREEREKAMEIFHEKLGTGLASNKFSQIFKAAKEGRIETLFVPVGRQTWGNFDNKTSALQINKTAKPGDKDLLCVTSTRTLQKGGTVYVVLPEQMPDNASIAAVMRY